MTDLTEHEIQFLDALHHGLKLGLASREQDKARQKMRRLGFAKVVMNPRRWVITPAGREALLGREDPDLVGALRKAKEAFDELFAYCLSNGVYNAWGKQLPCEKMNDAMQAVEETLRQIDGAP